MPPEQLISPKDMSILEVMSNAKSWQAHNATILKHSSGVLATATYQYKANAYT